MTSNNGFIYIRQHIYYNYNNVCKLGKTKNIFDRDNTYATSEYIRGKFIIVIEILDNQIFDDTFVEKLLQKYFSIYHCTMNGGREFYNIKIIDEIIPFLNNTTIKFNVLSDDDINNLMYAERIKCLKNLLKKFFHYKENRLRNKLQQLYMFDIINNLNKYKKTFIKAPTGFGKTHLYYKTIVQLKPKRILILTPRILLNIQIVEFKYSSYITNDNYNIVHFSDLNNLDKESVIKKYSENNDKLLMTCCYQSGGRLLEYIKQYHFYFDLIIFDEAHFITAWPHTDFLFNNDFCTYRLFGSATPTEIIEENPNIYGPIIEKVKVYELIEKKLLCNIVTIVKQLNEQKTEYHNLKNLIVESMTKYNKKKGIIYVNDCKNAENLYKLLQDQNIINVYIFISKNIDVENDSDTDIKTFELDEKPCVIICVGKISYGYDNKDIDFITLADPRQSDIDIRQIIGRGIRWKKNKLLHLLVPLFRDEFGNCSKNEHLKKYLDYIIGECGQDIIFKSNGNIIVGNNNDLCHSNNGTNYDGFNIPVEILNEYCTTCYNRYTNFLKFLKSNKIYDEISYNKLKENQDWLIPLGEIQKKYPKFCFRHIHPNNINFYWNKKDALYAFDKLDKHLSDELGKEKYRKLDSTYKLNKINELNNKIPNINFDIYYPIT